jgi:N-acetylneuraminic acid mutarotase
MSGSDTTDQPGTYGSQGVAAPGNSPGARDSAATWTDQAGNLWLFGGYGADSSTNKSTDQGDLNDLWLYANGEWTWKGGSNQIEQPGVYGTTGIASSNNMPGSRWLSAYWRDPSGNFWIFGGLGLDADGTRGHLNDLWKYTVATGQWAWISGPSSICPTQNASGCPGTYGDLGVASASNVPGARVSAAFWTDSCGNLWLFGGQGADSTGANGNLNDLWEFDPTTNMWTWKSGANIVDQNGTYGTLNTAVSGNVPGARSSTAHWTDKEGNLWLFGGVGSDMNLIACQNGATCELNDLWEYNPATGMWSWMGGSDIANQVGNYGNRGVAASANIPGARDTALNWTDGQGDFWLFGGDGYGASTFGDLNDLWEYTNGQWIWMNGSNQAAQPGTYGSLGVPASGNVPGARIFASGWIDTAGNLWLFGGDDIQSIPHGGKFNDLWEYQP